MFFFDTTRVDFAVEWNSVDSLPTDLDAGQDCGFEADASAWSVASGVINIARIFNHNEKFLWGNANAWATDYLHPEQDSRGESLAWIDNAHLMYYVGHGRREYSVSLPSSHYGCTAPYSKMRLGVRRLRWLVLDLCGAVSGRPAVDQSVMRTWSRPTDGDAEHPVEALHVLCTLIGDSYAGIDIGHGADFIAAISFGTPVGTAWLDAAFARSGAGSTVKWNVPIAIACGGDSADATARRDRGRLADRDVGPVPASHLAWKFRI
ncbi:DUF6345 domain-containing protein [Mycolicibacterium sp.]|uniref:DUF6345 domain-containing protein n=1 Tax=Mycolicibacterium sp. TaxID=2320850 RepID=UPI0037C60A85